MLIPSPQRGLTLIEVLVAMTISAILLATGVNSYTAWTQNTQIHTVAESIQTGLQFARTEAIKRNENVQVVFDADYLGWTVTQVSTAQVLRRDQGLRTLSNISVTPNAQGLDTDTFSGLGRLLATNADGSAAPIRFTIDNTAMDARDSRQLRVDLRVTGNVRMCDPAITSPDPRAC